jgi:ssDNA-binding Zn-finger/Zn-ribbon topoisomerase 1
MLSRLCQRCGCRIPQERLEAVPATTFCAACQKVSEEEASSPSSSGMECPRCASKKIRSKLVWRRARDPYTPDEFLGCSRYPHCQYIHREGRQAVKQPVQRPIQRTRENALATTKQVNYLIALGVSAEEANAMTIKQASAKIDEILRKRRAGG